MQIEQYYNELKLKHKYHILNNFSTTRVDTKVPMVHKAPAFRWKLAILGSLVLGVLIGATITAAVTICIFVYSPHLYRKLTLVDSFYTFD